MPLMKNRRPRRVFLVLSLAALSGNILSASQAAPRGQASRQAAERSFVSACLGAFARSPGDASDAGKAICECTVRESRIEKLPLPSLESETARIRKDPTYRIQDPRLLHALQNCSIDALRNG